MKKFRILDILILILILESFFLTQSNEKISSEIRVTCGGSEILSEAEPAGKANIERVSQRSL